jgi:hypothetical protein
MSMLPLGGVNASAAGVPLSQTKGAETERALKQGATAERQQQRELEAEAAAGIGKTEEEQQTSERDADGRRLWEDPARQEGQEEGQGGDQQDDQQAPPPPVRPRDPSGEAGNTLDLIG